MSKRSTSGKFVDHTFIKPIGVSHQMIRDAIEYTYKVLDALDSTLVQSGEPRLAGLLELANLSAVVGNLFRGGLAAASKGRFQANGPHKYPDLISKDRKFADIEIKVALEDNKPKGHLVKPGPHVTVRYVLSDDQGNHVRGKDNRGDKVWIWEVRVGELKNGDFSVSNTAGDSGKTAVINKNGMESLKVFYVDLDRCPISRKGGRYKQLVALPKSN